MPKQVEITPEVRVVLADCVIGGDGQSLILPDRQLEPPLYRAVDKVLTALGGKWDRRRRAHVFPEAIHEALSEALKSGVAVDQKRTLEQFFTPPAIAERVAELAELREGHLVLEPSAGSGELVRAACWRGANVLAVEVDSGLMPALLDVADLWPGRVRRVCEDFFEWLPEYEAYAGAPWNGPVDRVMMNPPFGNGRDMTHVMKALAHLRPGGILVAVMSPHWTFASTTAASAFNAEINRHPHEWVPLPEGSFKSAGTGVSTGILTIHKGKA